MPFAPLVLKQKLFPQGHWLSSVFSQQQMTPRAYVLIFFFWSLLTILTPALVLLSENSKPFEAFELTNGKNGGINMSRKVVGLTRKYQMLKVLAEEQNAPAAIPIPIKAPAPSPSPAPAPGTAAPVRTFVAGAGKVILTTLKALKEAR